MKTLVQSSCHKRCCINRISSLLHTAVCRMDSVSCFSPRLFLLCRLRRLALLRFFCGKTQKRQISNNSKHVIHMVWYIFKLSQRPFQVTRITNQCGSLLRGDWTNYCYHCSSKRVNLIWWLRVMLRLSMIQGTQGQERVPPLGKLN